MTNLSQFERLVLPELGSVSLSTAAGLLALTALG